MSNNEVAVAISKKAVDLLRKMNHDLRNPLNSLLATANMLEDGVYEPLTEQQLRAVQRVERSAQRILTVLEYTGNYVKAESGSYPLTSSEFDPRILLAEIKVECQPAADAKQIVLSVTTTDSVPPMVIGDQVVIRRIVLELVWNAISFSPSGRIEIISDWTGEWLIRVNDVGPGVPLSARPNLFEPFWRGKVVGSPVPTSGSGLGLATSQAFARLIRGRILFKENVGAGSSFALSVPIEVGTSTAP